MSLITYFFRKAKNDEDYETILSLLALDIQKRQVQRSEIRLRERRSTLLVTLYTLAGWVAYVSLWYMGILPNLSGHKGSSKVEKAMKGFPVVVGPVVILFIRRIVQIWYKRKGDAEDKMLQSLLKQQRTKVDEIKKKTNYYSTRDLIQRYDESTPASPVLRQRIFPASTQPSTPQRQPLPPNANPRLQTPSPLNTQTPAPLPAVPPRRRWYDKLADALLGDDDQTLNTPASRYALICEKCFAHNGLVKESVWEDAKYVCPKCGHFNRPARVRKQGRLESSPVSPASPSSNNVSHSSPIHQQQQPRAQNGSTPEKGARDPVEGSEVSMMEVDES